VGVGSVESGFVCKGSAWDGGVWLEEAMAADARAAAATAGRAVAWNTKTARPAHSHGATARAAVKVKAKIHDNCGDGLAGLARL
jgi:hypothetical protein